MTDGDAVRDNEKIEISTVILVAGGPVTVMNHNMGVVDRVFSN